MLLSWEEWAKDMVGLPSGRSHFWFLFISHQVFLSPSYKLNCILALLYFSNCWFLNWLVYGFSGVWHFDQMLLHEEGAVDAIAWRWWLILFLSCQLYRREFYAVFHKQPLETLSLVRVLWKRTKMKHAWTCCSNPNRNLTCVDGSITPWCGLYAKESGFSGWQWNDPSLLLFYSVPCTWITWYFNPWGEGRGMAGNVPTPRVVSISGLLASIPGTMIYTCTIFVGWGCSPNPIPRCPSDGISNFRPRDCPTGILIC